jgi:hypothetical protein
VCESQITDAYRPIGNSGRPAAITALRTCTAEDQLRHVTRRNQRRSQINTNELGKSENRMVLQTVGCFVAEQPAGPIKVPVPAPPNQPMTQSGQ